jgi:hypothetical protein
MAMTKEQMEEFFMRLAGPEGCDFKDDPVKSFTWKCAGGNDKTFAKKILTEMQINPDDQIDFLCECDRYGGHCDCEILFNAEERIMK